VGKKGSEGRGIGGDAKSLDAKIIEWLEKSGYPLEMHVAEAFQRLGFSVSQAEYYPDSDRQREIDVVASYNFTVGNTPIRLSFFVECKTSRDKPWVAFWWRGRLPFGMNPFVSGPGNLRGLKLRRALARVSDMKYPSSPESIESDLPAYGIVQAFKERDDAKGDASYVAVMQACKAAVALTKDEEGLSMGAMLKNRTALLGFPVIVLDGRLFEARKDEDEGAPVVAVEVPMRGLMVRNPDIGISQSYVTVVTKAALGAYLERTAEACRNIRDWCTENKERVKEALDRPHPV